MSYIVGYIIEIPVAAFGLMILFTMVAAPGASDRTAVLIGGLVMLLLGLVVIWAGTASKRKAARIRQEIEKTQQDRLQSIEKQAQQRKDVIWQHEREWGAETCQMLSDGRLAADMTQEMVHLAWGYPTSVDEQETTAKSSKERWVYGQPRKGANYVWFVNGKISKIQ